MNQNTVLTQLNHYQTNYSEEIDFQKDMIQFVQENADFHQRINLAGHLTASAWILSPDQKSILMIHHKKLNRWLQPGGHLEAQDDTLEAGARREAIEECGLTHLELFSEGIFDLDIHPIPEKGNEPAHFHYDVRFIYQTKNWELEADFAEVNHIKWRKVDELLTENSEQSIHRMLLKTEKLP